MVGKQGLLVLRNLDGARKVFLKKDYNSEKWWRRRQRMLNSWRKGVKKTWVTAGQSLPGSDGRNSLEWMEPAVGSTDHPSFLSRKYMRGSNQKLHSHCLGKKTPNVWVPVLGALAQALLETRTGKHWPEQFLLHISQSENFDSWMFATYFCCFLFKMMASFE